MQLTELKTFLAIIDSGSLVRASEKLSVTQSTVTSRLKSLESELGQSLINRQKSGASLTAAGVRLQRYASTIVELWNQARQETALPHGYSSMTNLGCHANLWAGTGESMFDYLQTTIPGAAINVTTGAGKNLQEWLNDGLIDLALAYSAHTSQAQGSVELLEERLTLVSTRKDSPIKFDPDYIFIEAGESFGQQHAAAYSDAGTARISFNSARLGLDYLLKNGGSAYLPERLTRESLRSKQLFELDNAPVFKRRTYLIYNKSAQQNWPWFDGCITHLTEP